jgi:hypothetical protein
MKVSGYDLLCNIIPAKRNSSTGLPDQTKWIALRARDPLIQLRPAIQNSLFPAFLSPRPRDGTLLAREKAHQTVT